MKKLSVAAIIVKYDKLTEGQTDDRDEGSGMMNCQQLL